MTLTALDWFRWIITFALMLFHCLVAYFILLMRLRKNKDYTSPFYLLYLMISFADIGTIINNFFVSKFIFIDAWKPWLFSHPEYNTILWLVSGYLIYLQAILHSAIAINRAWVSFYLMTGNSAIGKIGRRMIWLLPVLPMVILSVRFWGHTVYVYLPNGDLAAFYVETFVKNYHSTAGAPVAFTTSVISFILTIVTILRYRYLFKKYQHHMPSTTKQDIILFCQATLTLCFQLSYVPYYIMLQIGSSMETLTLTTFALRYFNYINDGASLCNPIALLVICKFVRNDFENFLLACKPKFAVVSPSNTGEVQN